MKNYIFIAFWPSAQAIVAPCRGNSTTALGSTFANYINQRPKESMVGLAFILTKQNK